MNIITISYSKTFSDTRVIKYIKYYLEKSFSVTCFGLDDNDNNYLYKNKNFKYTSIKLKSEKDYKKINYKFNFTKLFFKLLILAIIFLIFKVINKTIDNLELNLLNKFFLNFNFVLLLMFLFFFGKKLLFLKRLLSFPKRLLSFPKRLNHFYNEIIFFLERGANKKKFDIIHTHDLWTILVSLRIKKNFPNSKLVVDLHELYSELPNQGYFKKIIALSLIYYLRLNKKKIYKIITINEEIKNYYIQKFKLPSLVINNSSEDDRMNSSVNLDQIPASLIKLKQEGKKILIYQGGLSPYRGIEEMCNFFITSPPQNWFFLIMGNGNLKTSISNFVLKSNNIFLMPAVPLDKLAAYTNFADLGLINYENICLNHNFCNPNKLWEYGRVGLPMLLSNCSSFVNLNNQYGFAEIIRKDDYENLMKIFDSLTNEKLSKMSKNSRLFFNNNSWEKEKIKIDKEILY
jgi:hypothetical protein